MKKDETPEEKVAKENVRNLVDKIATSVVFY